MEEEKGGVGAESARVSTSFVSVGGRQRFAVELRPGETTIVSWKKLMKDVSKAEGRASAPEAPSNAHPTLESRIAPGQPSQNEVQDAPPSSRFSAVIEKIERLYMGKDSSDEEDLNDVPDDDQYDTEDSFIDDAELDEYFQVDNSAIKHDGFFVNRGTLEQIEPTSLPQKQPKKRRRKDLAKAQGEYNDNHVPNKHVKLGKKVAGKPVHLVEKNLTPSPVVALPTIHDEDVKFQNQMNVTVICDKKKSAENRIISDSFVPSRVSDGNTSLSLPEEKDVYKQIPSSKSQRSYDKCSYAQTKSQSGRLPNNFDELAQSVQRRETDGIHERLNFSVSQGKSPMQIVKDQAIQRREASSIRPKSTMLEKTIRELEKMVAESARPPAMEVQDADNSSQAVKRRLPQEVKQKLAKVARLAQASHGKISKELVNRLMSILGHLVQLRTLKRNLKIMVNMGLSAKKEKDDRFQQMKMEIGEMIELRVPYLKSKVLEQQAGSSDDFQEIGNEEKEAIKRKYSLDDRLEDKICDLYDLYVEGLDEDAGPLVRKLYAELAQLWPDGFMDKEGIKRAICSAKLRRKVLSNRHKDREKIKRKKMLVPRTEGTVRVDASSTAQPQYMQEKLCADSGNHGLASLSRPPPNAKTANMAVRMPNTSMTGTSLDWPKQDKVKGSSPNDMRIVDPLIKKKVKRKPELEFGEAHPHPERSKSHKQVTSPLHKPAIASAASTTNLEQPS